MLDLAYYYYKTKDEAVLKYLEIKDGKGSIRTKNKEDIYKIDKDLNIKSIEKDEENYYLLGVELWKRSSLEVL